MEFKFTAEDEEFRRELRAFMKAELPDPWEGAGRYPEEDDWDLNVAVRQKMAEKGWLTMHWPEEYGGQNASPVKSAIYNEEIAYMRAPGRDIFGVRMLGPTLMIHGSEEQKNTHLPSVAKGEIQWCQGYSEPESGSDLASLSTRAVRDGDWKLVAKGINGPWELYNLLRDRTESNNLADTHPDRVKQLIQAWEAWAHRTKIYPMPTFGA